MIVATHNLMNGLRLPALIRHHSRLQANLGLDVLCVQENTSSRQGCHARTIARSLGGNYQALSDTNHRRLGIVYNTNLLRCDAMELVPLPRLNKLRLLERIYIVEGRVEQKYAQLAVFVTRSGSRVAVVNFHLDTAGSNTHRATQLAHIATELQKRSLTHRFIACGDTNTFALPARRQRTILRELTRPLIQLGGNDLGAAPTHHFARQGEPSPAHRLAALAARFVFDLPLRYDILCANLPASQVGTTITVESDHDLVWAQLRVT